MCGRSGLNIFVASAAFLVRRCMHSSNVPKSPLTAFFYFKKRLCIFFSTAVKSCEGKPGYEGTYILHYYFYPVRKYNTLVR